MEHIFLLNPAAGTRHAIPRLVPQIRAASKQLGVPYTLYETRAPGDAARLVSRCAQTGKRYRFYACGGDGTLNEVVHSALFKKNIEVAAIPCGKENEFVHNLGGNDRFLDLPALLRSHPVPVDVMVSRSGEVAVSHVRFGCTSKKMPLSAAGTVSSLFSFLADPSHHPVGQTMAISTDDGEMQIGTYLLCTVTNGNFLSLSSGDVADGLLHFTAMRRVPRRDLLPLLACCRAGGVSLSHPLVKKYIQTKACRRITIRTTQPIPLCLDGESWLTNSLHLHIAPGAISFCIPE
jgi:diacylglycerol kinase family enzyme